MAGIDTMGDGSLPGATARGGAASLPSRSDSLGAVTDSGGDEEATLVGDGPRLRADEASIGQGAVIGRYVVLGRLGAGGMGVVHAAYDPELDRKVAIKLLLTAPGGGSHGAEARTRLMREAQALAKLSHPNVVAVYDVGTVGERVWMAMELVKGQTLAAWIAERRRPWWDVVRVMTAAGEGLQAAHEAGLLHRDFKPDNVMIDASGRVRVMDFGLARAGAPLVAKRTISGLAEPVEPGTLSQGVTVAGTLMGTPGYMAPEQLGAKELDARADQFAFGVSLWQALYGRKPFTGLSVAELVARVLAGEIDRPPAGVRVPGWLRRVCERAMAKSPDQRFPSMRALLDALARGQARGRQRAVLAAVGLVAAVGAGVFGAQRWDRARQLAACEAEGASIHAVWDDAARERVRTSLLATGVSHAPATADKVLPILDREAQAWAEHQTHACVQATVERRWDAEILDRARWCLEDRRLALESLVRVLSEADPGTVQRAVSTALGLEPSAACLDEDSLERAPPPPAEQDRSRVAEVQARLARVSALKWVGKPGDGLALLEELRGEVTELDWGPLWAQTSALESDLLEDSGSFARAEEAGITAYMQATGSSAWGQAAGVAAHLSYLVGYRLARPAEGRLWARHAAVAASFAGDPQGVHEAARVSNLGAIALGTGDHGEARRLFERALELRRASYGPQHLIVAQTLTNLGVAAWSQGETAEARRIYEEALPIIEEALGPDHPDLTVALGNLGAIAYQERDFATAKALYERILAIRTAVLPPEHPDLAASLDDLAITHHAMGEHERARVLARRALARWERAVDPQHPNLAICLNNLGLIEVALDHRTEALAAYERAVAIYRHNEGVQQYEHDAEHALAKLLVQTGGDRARALELARSARAGLHAAGASQAEQVAELDAWIAATEGAAP